MRVFAGQERLKAPGDAPSRYRSSTTDSIVFIIFTIAAIEHKLSSSSMSSSTINTEHQFSVPRGFFELLLLLIAASEICAVCCLCLLNREHTQAGSGPKFDSRSVLTLFFLVTEVGLYLLTEVGTFCLDLLVEFTSTTWYLLNELLSTLCLFINWYWQIRDSNNASLEKSYQTSLGKAREKENFVMKRCRELRVPYDIDASSEGHELRDPPPPTFTTCWTYLLAVLAHFHHKRLNVSSNGEHILFAIRLMRYGALLAAACWTYLFQLQGVWGMIPILVVFLLTLLELICDPPPIIRRALVNIWMGVYFLIGDLQDSLRSDEWHVRVMRTVVSLLGRIPFLVKLICILIFLYEVNEREPIHDTVPGVRVEPPPRKSYFFPGDPFGTDVWSEARSESECSSDSRDPDMFRHPHSDVQSDVFLHKKPLQLPFPFQKETGGGKVGLVN